MMRGNQNNYQKLKKLSTEIWSFFCTLPTSAAYFSSAYVIALPSAAFIALWRKRRIILDAEKVAKSNDTGSDTEIMKGMQFLYENYKARSWYWEMIETSLKVIVTSGLILVGQESRSYIGLAWVIAGLYGVCFAWNLPIRDAFENQLMTTSIAVTIFNLGIGVISKIPTENVPTKTDVYMADTIIFSGLVVGANTLVIGLIVCKIICFTFLGFFVLSPFN